MLEKLIVEKKADLSTGDDQIWFNLFAAHELIESQNLMQVVLEFTEALQPYLNFDDQLCFGCGQQKETTPIYHSSRLHLLCSICREKLNKKAEVLQKIDPSNVVFSLLW